MVESSLSPMINSLHSSMHSLHIAEESPTINFLTTSLWLPQNEQWFSLFSVDIFLLILLNSLVHFYIQTVELLTIQYF